MRDLTRQTAVISTKILTLALLIFLFHTSVVRTNIKTGELLKLIHVIENKDTNLFFTVILKPMRHKMQFFFFQINISIMIFLVKDWYLIDNIYYLCLLMI